MGDHSIQFDQIIELWKQFKNVVEQNSTSLSAVGALLAAIGGCWAARAASKNCRAGVQTQPDHLHLRSMACDAAAGEDRLDFPQVIDGFGGQQDAHPAGRAKDREQAARSQAHGSLHPALHSTEAGRANATLSSARGNFLAPQRPLRYKC